MRMSAFSTMDGVCGRAISFPSKRSKNKRVEGELSPRKRRCTPERISRRKQLRSLNMSQNEEDGPKNPENMSQNAQNLCHDEEKG